MKDESEVLDASPPAQENGGEKKKKSKKTYYAKTAKIGILWTGARRVGREAIAVPTTMILARLLTPEEFGIATVGRIFLLLAEHATQVGLPAAMVRIKELKPAHMSSSLVFGLATGAVAWLALTALAPLLATVYDTPAVADILPIAALGFLIAPFGGTARVPITRDMRFGQLAAASWITAGTQSATSVVLAWSGYGFWSLVWGHLAGEVGGAVARIYYSGWTPSFRFSLDALKDLWSYGLGRQIKGLLLYLGNNVDSLLVGQLLGMSALGLYDKAFVTLKKMTGRVDVGQGVAFRIFAIIRDDPPRFRKAFRKLALARSVVASPIFLGCVVVAPQMFTVLYGEQWLLAVPAFQVLCAFSFMQVLTRTAAMTNEVVGMMWWQVAIRAAYIGFVAVGVLVGAQYGVTGAAWGLLGARLVVTVLVHALLRHTTGLSWLDLMAPLVPALSNAAVLIAVLLGVEVLVREVVPEPAAWLLLVVQAAVGGAAYLTLMLYSPFKDVRAIASEAVSDFFPGLARRLRLA